MVADREPGAIIHTASINTMILEGYKISHDLRICDVMVHDQIGTIIFVQAQWLTCTLKIILFDVIA